MGSTIFLSKSNKIFLIRQEFFLFADDGWLKDDAKNILTFFRIKEKDKLKYFTGLQAMCTQNYYYLYCNHL